MEDRPRSYEGLGSRSTSSGYSPYGSQARGLTYPGGSNEMRGTASSGYSPYGSQARGSTYLGGSNEMRGTDIIAEYLFKEKVPYILGYAGHGAIGLLDGLYKKTDRIRHISPRIEQAAGFMADVYYRLTGQPLAVHTSTGPGPMNMMISVANAFYDCSAFPHHWAGADDPVQHRRPARRLPLSWRHVIDVHHRQEILAHSQG